MDPRLQSALLTKLVARRAIELSVPSLVAMWALEGLMKNRVMAIGVIDGTADPEDDRLPLLAKAVIELEEGKTVPAIQFAPDNDPYTFITADGLKSHTYEKVLMAKAIVTDRTGLKSAVVRHIVPECFRIGDTTYQGSWEGNGIIVASSGDRAYNDETFSGIVGLQAHGLVQHKMRIIQEKEADFITPELLEEIEDL